MSKPAAKPRAASVAAAVACALAGLALFQFFGNASRGYVDTTSLFWWWISQWLDPNADAGHGWLILALSGGLLWMNLRNAECGVRSAESSTVADPADVASSYSALRIPHSAFIAMAAGLALHALGFVAQQARVSIVAFLLFTWGVLRLGGGRRWGAAAVFPVAFMVFAIPLNVLDSVGFWLRVWVVDASAAIARAAGIGVLQSGTQLVAPDGRYNYDVAAACSGVRSLTAMAALSLLAGYLNFHSAWRRALVFLLCFPFVYLGNVARIVAIVFAAHWRGPKAGDVAHDVMGWGIFAIVLGGVLGGIVLLRRVAPETSAGVPPAPTGEAGETPALPRTARPYLIAGVVVALIAAEALFLRRVASMPARGAVGVALAPGGIDPVELPAFIGTSWAGRRAEVTPVEREILPADTGYSRKLYVSVDRPAPDVFLSIVLSGRDRTSIHRPELCLVGQGWTITDQAEHLFAANGGRFPARVLRVQREVQPPPQAGRPRDKVVVRSLVVYWFVGGDTIVASHWGRVLRDSWARVTRGRADRWAYVLMQTDAADGEPAALARLQAVLDGTLPAFQRPAAGKPSA